MDPTTGRIVHYVMQDGEHRPAIVLRPSPAQWELPKGTAQLVVFVDSDFDAQGGTFDAERRGGTAWRTRVPYSERKHPGSWHWPEAVGEASPPAQTSKEVEDAFLTETMIAKLDERLIRLSQSVADIEAKLIVLEDTKPMTATEVEAKMAPEPPDTDGLPF